MDRPLAPSANYAHTVNRFFASCARKAGAEPLDRIAALYEATGDLKCDQLRAACMRIPWTPPIEDQDPQALDLGHNLGA